MTKRPRHASSIDITPLMDLTFMLLIVFIITVPAMEYSTDVTPPPMNTPTTVENIPNKTVVSLNQSGVLKLNNNVVSIGELYHALRGILAQDSAANVLIISDGSRRYEEIIEIHRTAYKAGVRNIYLVTQAERN